MAVFTCIPPSGKILNKIVNLCIGGKGFANLTTFT